jgi:hypothetical protein
MPRSTWETERPRSEVRGARWQGRSGRSTGARRRRGAWSFALLGELKKAGKGKMRGNATSRCPSDELGDVNAPVGDFAVVYPTLWLQQAPAKLPLRQACLLAQGAQEPRHELISGGMLGLCRHLTRLSCQPSLTRVECQTTMILASATHLRRRHCSPGRPDCPHAVWSRSRHSSRNCF